MEDLQGYVEHIVFRNADNGYTVLNLISEEDEITCVGIFPVVTEGEILHAIRTEPRPTDVDGVKRRTRATMGRCQGGFCTPHIVELLARENGISPENVTKCGGASRILAGKTKGGC